MKYGTHINRSCGNLVVNLDNLELYGAQAAQFFLTCPEIYSKAPGLNSDEIRNICQLRQDNPELYLVVHGKLSYNFCRPPVDNFTRKQREMLKYELELADKIGVDVVIHQGKNVTELGQSVETAIVNYVDNIIQVLEMTKSCKNRILLENSAHQGTEIGYNLMQFAHIYRQIKDKTSNPDRIGICLDTCHAYVAGEIDFRNGQQTKKSLLEFADVIGGFGNIIVIHLNDSKSVFGSCSDRHDALSMGQITGDIAGDSLSYRGLWVIIRLASKHGVPAVLETPQDKVSLVKQFEIIDKLSKLSKVPSKGQTF